MPFAIVKTAHYLPAAGDRLWHRVSSRPPPRSETTAADVRGRAQARAALNWTARPVCTDWKVCDCIIRRRVSMAKTTSGRYRLRCCSVPGNRKTPSFIDSDANSDLYDSTIWVMSFASNCVLQTFLRSNSSPSARERNSLRCSPFVTQSALMESPKSLKDSENN